MCVRVCVCVCVCVKKQQFCSLRTQEHMIILTKQHAQTLDYHYNSEYYISLVAFLLDQQNAQFLMSKRL